MHVCARVCVFYCSSIRFAVYIIKLYKRLANSKLRARGGTGRAAAAPGVHRASRKARDSPGNQHGDDQIESGGHRWSLAVRPWEAGEGCLLPRKPSLFLLGFGQSRRQSVSFNSSPAFLSERQKNTFKMVWRNGQVGTVLQLHKTHQKPQTWFSGNI